MSLTKEQILGADDLPRHTVSVPEWGGDVSFRHLTAREQASLETIQATLSGVEEGRTVLDTLEYATRFVVLCVCDDQGKRLFADDDVPVLMDKNADALMSVFHEIQRVVFGSKAAPEGE